MPAFRPKVVQREETKWRDKIPRRSYIIWQHCFPPDPIRILSFRVDEIFPLFADESAIFQVGRGEVAKDEGEDVVQVVIKEHLKSRRSRRRSGHFHCVFVHLLIVVWSKSLKLLFSGFSETERSERVEVNNQCCHIFRILKVIWSFGMLVLWLRCANKWNFIPWLSLHVVPSLYPSRAMMVQREEAIKGWNFTS